MKIVVIGGTGLVGSQVVNNLREHGHEAVAASPQTGVNTLTGEGLPEVLEGAQVLIDLSNSPSFAEEDVARTTSEQEGRVCVFTVEGRKREYRGSILVRRGNVGAISALPAS